MCPSSILNNDSLPFKQTDNGGVACPYCNKDLTDLYENCDLESVGHGQIMTIKDSSYAEASCSMVVYFKCPYCNNSIEDDVTWDA